MRFGFAASRISIVVAQTHAQIELGSRLQCRQNLSQTFFERGTGDIVHRARHEQSIVWAGQRRQSITKIVKNELTTSLEILSCGLQGYGGDIDARYVPTVFVVESKIVAISAAEFQDAAFHAIMTSLEKETGDTFIGKFKPAYLGQFSRHA